MDTFTLVKFSHQLHVYFGIVHTVVACLHWSQVWKWAPCISTCLLADVRAPGGASEAALSQTPAGGFSSFIEGLKSNFGQPSQSTEGTSDQTLEEAASKAADEAADKALKSVGSQVPDTSAVAEKDSVSEQVSTALRGLGSGPSPPPSLTASMEAETDKNSDKPAIQALADGV